MMGANLPFHQVYRYYEPDEPDESGGRRVEFRLIYQGPLPSEKCKDTAGPGSGAVGRAKEKHELRKHFHLQLRELWNQHPDLREQAEQRFLIHTTPTNLVSDPGPGVRQITRTFGDMNKLSGVKTWLENVAA